MDKSRIMEKAPHSSRVPGKSLPGKFCRTLSRFLGGLVISVLISISIVACIDELSHLRSVLSAKPGDGTDSLPASIEAINLTGHRGERTVLLTWTNPGDPDFDRIEITVVSENANKNTVRVGKSAAGILPDRKVIGGLINGTAYTFTVNIMTQRGKSISQSTGQLTPASVSDILRKTAGGDDKDNPIRLPVQIDLSNNSNNPTRLEILFNDIEKSRKYVELDLSVCPFANGVFDPGISSSKGKEYIVSMVLPDTATSIRGRSLNGSAFLRFTSLKSISGENVKTVGYRAFSSRKALETANFPKATKIEDQAFDGCDALKTISLPVAEVIGKGAFSSSGGTTLAITLGSVPPIPGIDMFDRVSVPKPVVVKVPAGTTGKYDKNWQTGFKGGNTNITLTIENQ
jgi:hypothetical protein